MKISFPSYQIRQLDSANVKAINQQLTEDNKNVLGKVLYAFEKCRDDEAIQVLLIGEKDYAILDKVY